jgi:hypothetical protein
MERSSGNEGGFKVNHILKNAREGDPPLSFPSSMKSMTVVNRAQLTPIKAEQYERARGDPL